LRGDLIALRAIIRSGVSKSADTATRNHLTAADARIGKILDPRN
jgi:hypothetical protein